MKSLSYYLVSYIVIGVMIHKVSRHVVPCMVVVQYVYIILHVTRSRAYDLRPIEWPRNGQRLDTLQFLSEPILWPSLS